MLDGIVFRMRTGCQWNQMPERFGADSTVHGWLQRSVASGVLVEIWAAVAASARSWAQSPGNGGRPTG